MLKEILNKIHKFFTKKYVYKKPICLHTRTFYIPNSVYCRDCTIRIDDY